MEPKLRSQMPSQLERAVLVVEIRGAGGLRSSVRRNKFVAKLIATICPRSMKAQVYLMFRLMPMTVSNHSAAFVKCFQNIPFCSMYKPSPSAKKKI